MNRKTNQLAGQESRAELSDGRNSPMPAERLFVRGNAWTRAQCAARRPSVEACPPNRQARSGCAWTRFPETASRRFRLVRKDNSVLPKSSARDEASAPAAPAQTRRD